MKYFLKDIQEEIVNNAIPRDGAVDVINKLRSKGNEIYIITARAYEFHDDPYNFSKDWLDKNSIVYDKLIVNAINKAHICKEKHIDIFMDDQLHNCIFISNEGITSIRISKDKQDYDNIVTIENWESIYKYISKMENNK